MLEPAALHAQLFFFADSQPRGVELRDLKPQQILALGAIPLGRPGALELGSGRAVLREQLTRSIAELLGIRESIEVIELARRLQQALVFVLPVVLDQMDAHALEQPAGHRRIADEV